MNAFVLVGAGGLLGSMGRYGVSMIMQHYMPLASFPWATLTVNVVGSLLVGLAAHALEVLPGGGAELRLFIITGFLGGFTTFSAFSLETVALLRNGPLAYVIINVGANLTLCILAVSVGLLIGRSLS
ncbi:MAG: fluoride efflux transporter CrcB [Bdellovibrionota bacterium]|nr:MAG: fluoride efflux transporter CrcB [Bdellovibrionota bacterium]